MKLPQSWSLPEAIHQRLGQKSAGKQRAMVAEGHLLLILHQAPKQGKGSDREGAFFWRKPNGEWTSTQRGQGLQSLKKHIEAYSLAEEELTQRYEKVQSSADYFAILKELTPLHRAAKNLHAALQGAREGISDDRNIIDLRDRAAEIERTLELLYLDSKSALDFTIAQQAEEQSQLSLQSLRAAHRLNILAAIFFPLTAISCAFGMNLPTGFEGASRGFFWFVFAGGIALGFWVRRWVVTGKWL